MLLPKSRLPSCCLEAAKLLLPAGATGPWLRVTMPAGRRCTVGSGDGAAGKTLSDLQSHDKRVRPRHLVIFTVCCVQPSSDIEMSTLQQQLRWFGIAHALTTPEWVMQIEAVPRQMILDARVYIRVQLCRAQAVRRARQPSARVVADSHCNA